MSTKFFTRLQQTVDSDGTLSTSNELLKATFINNKLKIYTVSDSDDAGIILLNQPNSPFASDSETKDSDGNGNMLRVITQYNRPWENDSEAFAYAMRLKK